MSNKIAHIITRLDKGGSAENVLLTVTGLAEKGYSCTLIAGKTAHPAAELIQKAKESGVELIFVKSLIRSLNPVLDLIAFFRIIRLLSSLQPAIVHTHCSKAGILGRWAAKLSGIKKIVHTPHGNVFYGYYNQVLSSLFVGLEKIMATITERLVALTAGEKNESLRFGIGDPEEWVIIHSGVELEREAKATTSRSEFKIPENASVIGTVARLDSVKGIIYLIKAVKLLNSSVSVFCLIVGDGCQKEILQSEVARLNLSDRVIFTGWRPDVPELISLMDIYVQPSLNEGMGKTLIQAQSCGKPIVATRVGGIPDVVKENKTGILIPAQDSGSLAQAIVFLLKNKSVAENMGEKGKEWVTEKIDGFSRFSVELMIKRTEELYNSL